MAECENVQRHRRLEKYVRYINRLRFGGCIAKPSELEVILFDEENPTIDSMLARNLDATLGRGFVPCICTKGKIPLDVFGQKYTLKQVFKCPKYSKLSYILVLEGADKQRLYITVEKETGDIHTSSRIRRTASGTDAAN
jgi:hypothetical protein